MWQHPLEYSHIEEYISNVIIISYLIKYYEKDLKDDEQNRFIYEW
jgi:hypothetical protein